MGRLLTILQKEITMARFLSIERGKKPLLDPCSPRNHFTTRLSTSPETCTDMTLEPGAWCLVPGAWCLVPGAWRLAPGASRLACECAWIPRVAA